MNTASLPLTLGLLVRISGRRTTSLFACAFVVLLMNLGVAQSTPTPPKRGAALLKTDIMGVFAHPDDETGMAATLAYYALGKNSVVANVYCTRGEGGGNMVGTQAGAALGALREAELRDCLSTLGVRYAYFLDRLDWAYTESAEATLRKWDREQTLERLVLFIRALRPEVIVTMNPAPTPGQHGHHQAAGVLATEAFAAAADPTRFPSHLRKEGLAVWQARKLFYGGESGEVIATISVADLLPNGKTPGQVAGLALSQHRSQGFGNFGNSPRMQRPQKFTLVKSLANPAGTETDLLAGLPIPDAEVVPVHFAKAPANPELAMEFIPRPSLVNYRSWVKEQGIQHVATRFGADLPLVTGEANDVRLQLINSGRASHKGELAFSAPAGWLVEPTRQEVEAPAGKITPIVVRLSPPAGLLADVDLAAVFRAGNSSVEAIAKAHPLPRTDVVRLNASPAVDGTDRGWETVSAIAIPSANLVQGRAADDADSSATFRLAHDGRTLFVDVQVRDDAVVSNIAPDDIKGHWRSDSVEICLDPIGGAEDTMGCYKLGIFPFDSNGAVRAARDADARQGPVEETAPKTRLVAARTSEGYRIQTAMPFEEIGLRQGQRRLGFNIIVYDGDKRDAAPGENINKSRIAWAPRPGVQGRPEDWGQIDLR